MASYLEKEVDSGRYREIVSHAEVKYVDNNEEMATKSRKRKLEDSPHSYDRGNSPSARYSNSNEAVNSDQKERNHHDSARERDEFLPGSSNSKRPKHDLYTDEFKEREAAQTESFERKESRESHVKKSRKSSSPSSSKHKKHKKSRERESRKESPSKRDRESSRRRSRSPGKKSRARRSSSPERNVKISPERRHDLSQSTSEAPDRKFRIPKKTRTDEDDKDDISKNKRRHDDEDDYKPPEKQSRKVSSLLRKEIEDILRTEHHHVIRKSKSDVDGVPHVEWCYYYLDPRLPGHITGGRAHLHHFCRKCKRTCLHLLGTYGTGDRKCLVCAADEMGWDEDEVPSWYFHDNCEHCENDTRRKQGGGGFRGGGRFGGGGGYRRRDGYDSGYRSSYSSYSRNRYNY